MDSNDEIARLRDRLIIAPRDTAAMRDLAVQLEAGGYLPGAIDICQRSLRVEPYDTDVLLHLGTLWTKAGDVARAGSWFERVLAIDPESAAAREGLQRLAAMPALPAAFIRALFDQYADRFDADLTGALNYRAPILVAQAVGRCGVGAMAADILDLGCGTGLSGAALKHFAKTLEGVDLSPGMLAKARLRAIYDALAIAEAVEFLRRADRSWDVIAAVDVLNYVEDLKPIFDAAGRRLRPGGFLVGTVEKRAEGGVMLTAKRRYAHGADYLPAALDAVGLALIECVEATLRTEGGSAVAGLIFTARR
jgi:predicted TPR repeat methyltransferase